MNPTSDSCLLRAGTNLARTFTLAMIGSVALVADAGLAQTRQSGGVPKTDEHGHAAGTHDDAHEHDVPAKPARAFAFEWGGAFELPQGTVTLVLQPGPDDPSLRVALIPVAGAEMTDFEAVFDRAQQAFQATPKLVASGGQLAADGTAWQLALGATRMTYSINVPSAGIHALFTEHMPWEFKATLQAAGAAVVPIHVRQFRTQEARLTSVAVKTSGLLVGKAVKRTLLSSVAAPARVSFNQEAMAHVGSPLKGWVVEQKVRLGDTVTKGQALLVIESPDLGETQSDYLLKRAAAEATGPAVELAKDAYERAAALYKESQGLSLNEVQRRELEYRAAQAARRSAESAMTAAENRLHLLGMRQGSVEELVKTGEISPRYTRLAPIAGTVVEREVTLGELVGPEQGTLLVLADMETLWVLAEVPETRMREVHVGAKAIVKAVGSQVAEIEGSVSYISPIVDPTSRTTQVRIVVSGGASGLRAGMFARVEITSKDDGGGKQVLAIPEEAVQTIDGQASVFVPVDGADNTFAKRLVVIGRPVGGMVPVRSGLREGELVVMANSFILKAELGKSGAQHQH